MPKKSVDEILKELGPVMKSSAKTLKDTQKAMSAGTVKGDNVQSGGPRARKAQDDELKRQRLDAKKTEAFRTAEQAARGLKALGKGAVKGRSKGLNKMIDSF